MSATPGPWEQHGSFIWSTGENGGSVCIIAEPECDSSDKITPVKVSSKRWKEAMANGKLIRAAPELLEALGLMLAQAELFYRDTDDCWAAIHKARAAIAKATGGIP